MFRGLLVLIGLTCASLAHAGTHGIHPAAITYNSDTYTPCNGTGNDSSGFATWKADVLTWQSTHTGLVQLEVPSGRFCMFTNMSGAQAVSAGIKQFRLMGYGATFSDNDGTGAGFFLGGGPTAGVQFNGVLSTVRLATVAAGSSTVTVLDTSQCGLWAAGDWALVGGIDPQGNGDPPNPQIFEYVQIASVASCAGSGVISLTAPLKNAYKSTWPVYNVGDLFHSDGGGPGTLYALGQNWVTSQEYRGLTLDQVGQTYAIGQNITYRDVKVTGSSCIVPTQNGSISIINATMTNCFVEVDKIIDSLALRNVTTNQFNFQSASVNTFTVVGSTITTMNGTPKITNISGSTITNFQMGAHSFGASGAMTVSNSVLTNIISNGANQSFINLRGTWSGGKLSVPNSTNIVSAADNGLPDHLIRVLVGSTAGYSTGFATTIAGLGSGPCGGDWIVTVDGPTHFILQNSTFIATCTGTLGSLPLNWAVPGANLYWNGRFGTQGPVAQITDITQDANGTYVQTTLPGAFPTMPLNTSGGASVIVHAAPKFSCTSCTGSVDAVDLSQVPARDKPLWTYSKRTYNSATATVSIPMWGQMTSIKLDMPTPYSGASALLFGGIGFITFLNSVTFTDFEPDINTKLGGERSIFPTTTSGALSGDSISAPGSGTWLVGNQNIPCYFVVACTTPGDMAGTAATIEIITNQGVVYPHHVDNDNDELWYKVAM